jgi:hypothetical protein
MAKKKKNMTVRAELTYGQLILCPNMKNIRESRLCNGAIYRLLHMTFVRILNPKLPPDVPPKREIYVLKYDTSPQQHVYESKDELCAQMVKAIREHPEFNKGLEVLL